MNRIHLYDQAIIIAPRASWDFFYAYRDEYPDAVFSLYSEEDVEALFSYQHDERAVVYLLKKGYSFELANDYLSSLAHCFLPSSPEPKLQKVCEIRDELLAQGLIYKDAYPEKSFSGRNIVIHGYADTSRISLALDDVPSLAISFDAVLVGKPSQPLPPIHQFKDIYGELHYVFNRIADLIDGGVAIDNIYLAGVDPSYDYLLPFMGDAYGFAIEMRGQKTLADLPLGRYFELTFRGSDLTATLEQCQKKYPDDPNLPTLQLTAQRYAMPDYSKDDQARLYHDVFSSLKEKKTKLLNAVHLLDGYFPPENSHVFFLSFALGNAPVIRRDDDFLTDKEKNLLYVPSSLVLNNESKADLFALLHSGHIESLTYKERSLGQDYFLSPLTLEEKFEVVKSNELPYEYSRPFARLWCSSLCDLFVHYLKNDEKIPFLTSSLDLKYKDYDYRYQRFSAVDPERENVYSYSSINSFYECQFHYYCDYVLRLGPNESNFMARVGTIYHAVLQRIHQEDFNFEEAWLQAYGEEEGKNGSFSEKERVLLVRLKDELPKVIGLITAHEKTMNNPRFGEEVRFNYQIKEKVRIRGSIDKTVLTGPDQSYLSVIDYKTGSANYDESLNEYGLSLQLPIYAYVATHDPAFSSSELIGLYIDHILAKTLVKSFGKDYASFISDQLKLKGVYTSDKDKLATFEPNYEDSGYIAGLSVNKDGSFSTANKAVKSPEQLAALAELAKDKVLAADEAIRQNDFTINPKLYPGKVNSCQYCPYRDICYVRDEARIALKALKDKGEEPSDE